LVSDEQVRLLRRKRMEGKTQVQAAALAVMSERTARRWEKTGALPSAQQKVRAWKTRPDAFAGVWEQEVVPLLKADVEGRLEGRTLLRELQRRKPGQFQDGQLRTLQRRIRDWRALYGPDKEVYFPQEHVPGREAAVDFTHGTELGVTIGGRAFAHLLFEFVLSYSGWTWVCLAQGETFEALSWGLQGALWDLGGSPQVVRSDNLSAATHELKRSGGRTLTRRYENLLEHYSTRSTRIRPGQPHENGVVEQKHYRTKRAVAQALVLRGSSDFDSVPAYESFVREIVGRDNLGRSDKLALERGRLLPLPASPLPCYTTFQSKVTTSSTAVAGGRRYSVPSRLIGHHVELRQHTDVVEVYYTGRLVETMPRLRGEQAARIDYRHVVGSLVRKPGAFARYRFRDELFPTLAFRRAYDALKRWTTRADIEYVRILHLAATTMESQVEHALEQLMASGTAFDYKHVQELVRPEPQPVPTVSIPAPNLSAYDALLGTFASGGGL